MAVKEPKSYINVKTKKMAYSGHVFRGSSGITALFDVGR